MILYATGLGATRPRMAAGQIPTSAAILEKLSEFKVLAGGEPIDRANILYAGAAPGFAGLYQINLRLPGNLARNPELQIGFNNIVSPTGIHLPLEAGNP